MGCFTEPEFSSTVARTLLSSGEAEAWEVVAALLVWEDVDVRLVASVGATPEDGPEREVLVWPPEIAWGDVTLELTGILLCPTEVVT